MTYEKDGEFDWSDLNIVDKAVVAYICILLAPVTTLQELYYYLTGQSEKAQWSGTSYEHDHIDELWMRNRGGGGD